MLWNKEKYVVKIKGGRGQITTNALHGLIQQFIVVPTTHNTYWSMSVMDKEGDIIHEVVDHKGRLDDRSGLPVGRDSSQKVTILFQRVTGRILFYRFIKNENITIIIKVREAG